MGVAKIVSGGQDGRYTIELDYGKAQRDAQVAAFTARVGTLTGKLAASQLQINDVQEREDALSLAVAAAWEAYASAPPQTRTTTAITAAIEALGKERAANDPLRWKHSALRFDMIAAQRALALWTAFSPVTTRDAWCIDFSEDAEAGGYVGTAEIPGEPSLTLIVPSARAWIPTDGQVKARELQSPWQSYFNAAILPGWQKWLPTYRWGTITELDQPSALCNVSLAAASSSALSLGVNQTSVLTGVPIVYMGCNADVFEVGDRVVVKFLFQDWSQPVVIGFLDNPRACKGWKFALGSFTDANISGPPRYLTVFFQSIMPNALHTEKMSAASTVSMEFRQEGGGWFSPSTGPTSGPLTSATWTHPDAALSFTLQEPNWLPTGGGFIYALGAPAHLAFSLFVNSGWAPGSGNEPYYPLDSIIEARLTIDGEVFANVAIKAGFQPYAVDCDVHPTSGSGAEHLDYVRFVEE
jgi:hypothetical protein